MEMLPCHHDLGPVHSSLWRSSLSLTGLAFPLSSFGQRRGARDAIGAETASSLDLYRLAPSTFKSRRIILD